VSTPDPTKAEITYALYGRKSKYGAKRTNGYASKREANIAAQLQALQRADVITGLCEQVRFELVPAQKGARRSEKPLVYVADFTYQDKNGLGHVVDVKGLRTPMYIAKRKLMLFIHKIEVERVLRSLAMGEPLSGRGI
jgi:hypothetical protein